MFKVYKKIISLIIILIITLNVNVSFADSIVIDNFSDVIENSNKLDRTEVIVKGEVIGEALKRKDGTWLNISDGSVAVGLFAKEELLKDIKIYGNYDYRGDVIEAKGIFHKACVEHDGEIDFHVNEVRVVSKGRAINHNISNEKVLIVTIITIILLFILRIFVVLKKQKSI